MRSCCRKIGRSGWAAFEVKKKISVDVTPKNLNRMDQFIALAIPPKPPHNRFP
jgi:hypothetical protein